MSHSLPRRSLARAPVALVFLLAACDDDAKPTPASELDLDDDGVFANVDCDDADKAIGAATTFYPDHDGDGLGDPALPVSLCTATTGYVAQAGDDEPDCATNDTDDCGVCAGANAAKDCHGDCFGSAHVDACGVCNGPGPSLWFSDVDGDGLGDAHSVATACTKPEGKVDNGDDLEPDCATNDTDDCGVCAGPGSTLWYSDDDHDGLGDPAAPTRACASLEGHVANADDLEPDCTTNDSDACGVCAGPGPVTYYADVDHDTRGDARDRLVACAAPVGYVLDSGDPEPDCATDDTDACGVCAGAERDRDCAGECFGAANIDLCDRCAGGTSGVEPATSDFDHDGTPDLCDDDCVAMPRFIVQWENAAPYYDNRGGPYTFELVLFGNGDIFIQYGDVQPWALPETVGLQGSDGAHPIEFSYQTSFPVNRPTVQARRMNNTTFIADYSQPFYWLDIAGPGRPGTRADIDDDDFLEVPLGFEFPFLDGRYTEITLSDNGFVGFSGPYGSWQHEPIPDTQLGAFIAPLWSDFSPDRSGGVWYWSSPPTCAVDCNGVPGGLHQPGPCNTCLSGLESGPANDCAGVCGGTAAIDGCGICAGGTTGITPRQRDCAGVCGGTAALDDCRICTGGTTGVEPSDPDSCPRGVDLIVDREEFASTIEMDHVVVAPNDCLIAEKCVGGPGDRKVVRFATTIANIGNEDLQLGAPGDGGEHWHFDECHSHYHYEAYAGYSIFDVAAGELLPIGSKNGFCVLDSDVYDPSLAPNGCHGYSCADQGITAGCSDTYYEDLQCQWIDVTGLPDGLYDLIVTTNPEGEIPEISTINNSATVRVNIQGENVEVIDTP